MESRVIVLSPIDLEKLLRQSEDRIVGSVKRMIEPGGEPLWTVGQAAEYLGVARKTMYQWNSQGKGPKPVRLGKTLRYEPEEVRHYASGGAN